MKTRPARLATTPANKLLKWRRAQDANAKRDNWALKTLLSLKGPVASFLALALSAVIACGAETVTVSWGYPADELEGVTFRVYHSRTLATPIHEWELFAQVESSTNLVTQIEPGPHYMTVTASNFWGIGYVFGYGATPKVVNTNGPVRITR